MPQSDIVYIPMSLAGVVANFDLGVKDGIWYALFEALSNSIQSIYLNNIKSGTIDIVFQRDNDINLETDDASEINNIIITDNGVGFNEQNFSNFKRGYTTSKDGCKGIGRISFLKVFEKAVISSTYIGEDGNKYKIEFDFSTKTNLEDIKPIKVDSNEKVKTQIILKTCKPAYKKWSRKNINSIKSMIQEHFYPMLHTVFKKSDICIKIFDEKNSSAVINKDSFKEDLEQEEKITITHCGVDYLFDISHIKTKLTKQNMIHYCAGGRVVKSEQIEDLRKQPVEADFYYNEYVSSPFFEENVNQTRGNFAILDSDSMELSWDIINENLTTNRKTFLSDTYDRIETDLNNSIDEFISENPEFAYIKKDKLGRLQKIPFDVTKDKIARYIKNIHNSNIDATRYRAEKFLSQLSDTSKNEIKQADIQNFLDELKEKQSNEGWAELCGYINYRKWIITLLDKYIRLDKDDKYAKERIIHDLIAPIGSYEIASNNHNLWLVDDKLAFYKFLKSEQQAINNSTDRPDILCYNEDIDSDLRNSLTLIELKKPGRDNTHSYEQILTYIDQLKSGGIKDKTGRTIFVGTNTLFYCYIIQDIESNDETRIIHDGFKQTGVGTYFLRPQNYETTTIEIINYDALLRIAKKRNEVFFQSLLKE
jgi:hypothetical protein